jgi:DNA replication protein DnaC
MTESKPKSTLIKERAFAPEEVKEKLLDSGVARHFLCANLNQIPHELQKRIEPFFQEKSSLLLYGPPGTGKTFILAALMRRAIEEWRERIWRNEHPDGHTYDSVSRPEIPSLASVPEVMLAIRESFKRNGEESEEEIIRKLSQKRVLFLDDLGVEKPTESTLQSLYLIIDNRYRNERQTVFTSNLGLSEIAERVGDRIASRISEMCRVIKITGRDRRVTSER